MATTKARAPQAALAIIGNDRQKVGELFTRIAPAIGRVLPEHFKADKMLQVGIFALQSNPDLAACTQISFLSSLFKAAKMGLELDPRGHVYLIPRRTGPVDSDGQKQFEAHFQIGYHGLIDLARRSGQIENIEARVVRECDEFEYQYGTTPHIRHIPRPSEKNTRRTHAYAVAWLRGAAHPQFEVLEAWQVGEARSNAGTEKVWSKFPEPMWKKTAIRRLCPYLPSSLELQTAASLESLTEAGKSQGADQDLAELNLGLESDADAPSIVDDVIPPDDTTQEGGA